LEWGWKYYAGADVNSTLTNSQVLALISSALSDVFPPQISFAGGTKYFWYWIPASFTQPSDFIDASTLIPIDMEAAIIQTVTNANAIATSYKGYRSTYLLVDPVMINIS
jgi:hypothetical protein